MLPPNTVSYMSDQQPLSRFERPRCARCQTRMLLERVSTGPIGFEHRLFECPKCNNVETRIVASDTNNSESRGWTSDDLSRGGISREAKDGKPIQKTER